MKCKHSKIEMKLSGIYTIKNLVNNKVYVGSTIRSFKKRFKEHENSLEAYNHYNVHLQNSYEKYGGNNFEFIIEEIINSIYPQQYFFQREQIYIDEYKSSTKEGYNLLKYADLSDVGIVYDKMTNEEASNFLSNLFIERGCTQKDAELILKNDTIDEIIVFFNEYLAKNENEIRNFKSFISCNFNDYYNNWQYPNLHVNNCVKYNCMYCDKYMSYCKFHEKYFNEMLLQDIQNCKYNYKFEKEVDQLFYEEKQRRKYWRY